MTRLKDKAIVVGEKQKRAWRHTQLRLQKVWLKLGVTGRPEEGYDELKERQGAWGEGGKE